MKAIEASNDSMIRLARLVDQPARAVREIYEQQIEEPQRSAYGKLANARSRCLEPRPIPTPHSRCGWRSGW